MDPFRDLSEPGLTLALWEERGTAQSEPTADEETKLDLLERYWRLTASTPPAGYDAVTV